MEPPLQQVYDLLFQRWGPQQWWPAESNLEMILGAILTQNTAWRNVERAIENLRINNALDLLALEQTAEEQLAEWIRPAGYFNQKASRIKALIETLRRDFDGSVENLLALDKEVLRKTLLAMKGIGPETADSIILYAAKKEAFVVDAYTRRFLLRHGWLTEKASYDEVAALFTRLLPPDPQLFNEYHALIVQLGKTHCKTKAHCQDCPLNRFNIRTLL
jgi:endonuclease III related protein